MPELFGNFDFKLLDDPEFREDAVREELIVPLLTALGYSASPPYRIIRSRKLEHPFVYFGTVPKKITIIPDYVLERDGEHAWILDAKAPDENIDTGKNVEQAYSYAMHRDIRAPLYGLCNGRKLVVFDVARAEPLIDIPLPEIGKIWPMVLGLLGCRSAWPAGLPPGFTPDMGLALAKAGLAEDADGKKLYHVFTDVPVHYVGKVEETLYCITALYVQEDCAHMLTFDFSPDVYAAFLEALNDDERERVRQALSRQPYQIAFKEGEEPIMTIVGDLGDKTYTNKNESYRPFLAEEFVRQPDPPREVGSPAA
ncbi:MAG: hypothetical protein AB7F99_19640 [Vicinamibacterales bacterium]